MRRPTWRRRRVEQLRPRRRRRRTPCPSDRPMPRNTISWTWSWSTAFSRWVAPGCCSGQMAWPRRFATVHSSVSHFPADRGTGVSALFRSRNSSQCVSIFYTNNQARYLETGRHGICGWVQSWLSSPKLKWIGQVSNLYSYSHIRIAERMNENDLNSSIPCPPWSNRVSKMAQPNLDFMGE